ncbi:type II toxin-antitoxin system RelE/ParE family toxin [Nocardioides hungaricus]
MIRSCKHKGLRDLFEKGSVKGVQPAHARRLRLQLAALHTAQTIDDMDVPGYRLHQLKGPDRGRWSITVNGNWRVTLEFRDGDAYVLNYEDYH